MKFKTIWNGEGLFGGEKYRVTANSKTARYQKASGKSFRVIAEMDRATFDSRADQYDIYSPYNRRPEINQVFFGE